MFRNVERLIATILTVSRWLMAPLYLGLIVALGVILVEFYRELAQIITGFGESTPEMVKLAVLKLVDIVLVGNLVVIMTAAGIRALASNVVAAADPDDEWMGKLDFNAVKFKILASIVAIVAIELLETYVNLASTDRSELLWKILILLALALSGVLLAWTDRLTSDRS
jgi:uncharacterized protein (TIGR00645 family)